MHLGSAIWRFLQWYYSYNLSLESTGINLIFCTILGAQIIIDTFLTSGEGSQQIMNAHFNVNLQ